MAVSKFDYDLFVIGGGSGGVRAARIAAQHGAKVAIAEEYRYGGTCVIRGCVPKKLFVYASQYAHDLQDAAAYGWKMQAPVFDWPTLLANKDREIDRLNRIYIDLLERNRVTVFAGRASLGDPHTIEVSGKSMSAHTILIATGARPRMPEIPGVEHAITSNEAFHLDTLPKHITVVGGGYIGVEFAHIFRGFGTDVAFVHRGDKVLSGFDQDIRDTVTEGLGLHGVDRHLGKTITAIEMAAEPTAAGSEASARQCRVKLSDGEHLDTGAVMYAIGRIPNTADMGLEANGVTLDSASGAVVVDDDYRTTAAHVYAVGDCTDRVALTPIAIREGQAFADAVFGNSTIRLDYENIPTAVFSQPPVGTVGLTEQQARERFGGVDVYMSRFRPMHHTLPSRDEKVMMKIVVARESQRVVGIHIVGHEAGEMIQCLAVAVHMGAKKSDLDSVVAVHPTIAEEIVLMRQKVR